MFKLLFIELNDISFIECEVEDHYNILLYMHQVGRISSSIVLNIFSVSSYPTLYVMNLKGVGSVRPPFGPKI